MSASRYGAGLERCERRLELSFNILARNRLATARASGPGVGSLGVVSSCRHHAGIEQGDKGIHQATAEDHPAAIPSPETASQVVPTPTGTFAIGWKGF